LFFVSPILWKPDQVALQTVFVDSNPFFHLFNVVRQPLLGQLPPLSSWIFVLALVVVSTLLAGLAFARFRSRLAYWV
jgi:ABC-type polysaccharide/polyol phosphate export permease